MICGKRNRIVQQELYYAVLPSISGIDPRIMIRARRRGKRSQDSPLGSLWKRDAREQHPRPGAHGSIFWLVGASLPVDARMPPDRGTCTSFADSNCTAESRSHPFLELFHPDRLPGPHHQAMGRNYHSIPSGRQKWRRSYQHDCTS